MSIKDVYPNYFDFKLTTPTTAADFDNFEIELPIASFYSIIPKGKVRGMEFIVLEIMIPSAVLLDLSTDQGNSLMTGITLGDAPVLVPDYTDSDTIFMREWSIHQIGTGAVGWIYAFPVRWSFVGGKLVVGKKINVWIAKAGTWAAVAHLFYRIYYRFVDVPVNEFISMIQFQTE